MDKKEMWKVWRTITPADENKPYAKYYWMKTEPDEDFVAQYNRPLDPSDVLDISKINDFLKPDYQAKNGWYVYPNGAFTCCVQMFMKDVTPDMIYWWFCWHSLEHVRMNLWNPWNHLYGAVREDSRKIILDPHIPLRDKVHMFDHYVIEDGTSPYGPEILMANVIHWMTPEAFGIKDDMFASSNVDGWVGAIISDPMIPENEKAYGALSHFVRPIEGGVEFTLNMYTGCTIVDGNPVYLKETDAFTPEMAYALAMHCVYEFDRLAKILPQLYEEQEGRLD